MIVNNVNTYVLACSHLHCLKNCKEKRGQINRMIPVANVTEAILFLSPFLGKSSRMKRLTLWRPETPKWVLSQTVKTQMKCRIMQHFIRVCTVCWDKINLQRKKYIFQKFQPLTPQYIMDSLDLTVSNFMEKSIGPKRVNNVCKTTLCL